MSHHLATYLVFEYIGNFHRVHLVMERSADLAIQEVYEYLLEEENQDEPLLTGYYMIEKEQQLITIKKIEK